MKRIIITILAGFALLATVAFAGNGDLIVDGKLGVGVGTTVPPSPLVIKNPTGVSVGLQLWNNDYVASSAGSGLYVGFSAASGAANAVIQPFKSGNTSYANLVIPGGNVGIGTTTPKTKLEVSGTKNTDQLKIYANTAAIDSRFSGYGAISIVGYDGTSTQSEIRSYSNLYFQHGSRLALLTSDALGNGPIERMRILENGYVGIGTSAPTQMLDVQGQVASNGVVLTSDLKFKEHLLPINTALDKVLNLTGHSYKWKTDEYKDKNFPEGRHYGVIAQEIEKVLPEVINTAPDGSKAVAYTEIIPVLIEAMKEQQKEIEQLKKKVAELQK